MMTPEELKKLDDAIAAKRAEREKLMVEVHTKRAQAHKLSEEIRKIEAGMPTPKQRRGIVMSAEAAKVALKPRR